MKSAADAFTNIYALQADLKLCSMQRDLQWGRRIHAEGLHNGHEFNMHFATALIRMYSKCGSMPDARRVFRTLQKRNVVSWNALLLGYAVNGEAQVCLNLFAKMQADGCAPDSVTYVAALKACASLAISSGKAQALELGRKIHLETGCFLNLYVQNTLIDMYAKCGSMVHAREVFHIIQEPDVVSWTALLLGYAENGEAQVSLELFSEMKSAGCAPNSKTYLAALKACTCLVVKGDFSAKAHCLEMGTEIHLQIGDHLDVHLQNILIDMYCKCGSMVDARHVFDSIKTPDVVSWTALLLGYAENGQAHVSLELFYKMKADGCRPNSITYAAVMKACGSLGALDLGRKFHSEVNDFTGHVVTSLVTFYAQCGSMLEARGVFDLHSQARDIRTWNALFVGYSSCGDFDSVFQLFETMQDLGFLQPNAITFVCILMCCSHAGLVSKARQYLEAMPEHYGVTPNVFHYNCMIDALGRADQLIEALSVLRRMSCNPTAITWRALLGACFRWKNVRIGKLAYQSLVDMNQKDAFPYVMSGSLSMWEWEELT